MTNVGVGVRVGVGDGVGVAMAVEATVGTIATVVSWVGAAGV